jgi:hypothetical protein
MEEPRFIEIDKRSARWTNAMLLSSFLLLASCHSTNNKMETGSVKGILSDSAGSPVEDAVVMIVEGPGDFNDIASVSNENGEFYMSNIEIPGQYVLQIRRNDSMIKKQVNVQSKDSVLKINL